MDEYISKEQLHLVVSANIKKLRKEKGMTQEQLSEKIHLSHEYLRQLESEKGQKDFSFYTLYKISRVLNVSLDDFL